MKCDCLYITEAVPLELENCRVARGLCKLSSEKSIFLQVVNFGEEELRLRKGTQLATMSKVEEIINYSPMEQMADIRVVLKEEEKVNFLEKVSHLSPSEKERLLPILEEYKDLYPLPNINETLDFLGGCRYFSTLDLTSGYYQIPMDQESQAKTAFNVESGHFQYTRMPFGLKNAPATFQRMIDGLLRGLKPTQCLVYLDDVIVFGSSIEQHMERLRNVFEQLRGAKLSLNSRNVISLRRKSNIWGI